MTGWIKLYRSILDHWVFQDADYFRAWCTIILRVNHEPKKVLIRGEVIECGRGQSVLSLQSWVKEFGVDRWSIQKVRTFFKLLENDGMINTEGMAKTTRLTVCNYEDYQNEQHSNNMQPTRSQHAANMHLTTTKETKNDKNEKKEPANAGGDFINQVYGVFKNQYKQHRNTDYVEATAGKDRTALGKIVKAIKSRKANEGKDTEQMLVAMDKFFNHALSFDDAYIQDNMTPMVILNNINKLLSPKAGKKVHNPHEFTH